ncbi:MAG: glycosyltransferase family 4 protein [Caldilineaceae bacterium SB0662_bin_9]|uniref:Glycosyltransferase family 4 protein n=1 Tax=Caldilineaceae bacterium SB0662_bin_9 TaxID=2605258 RepID=A0A6B1DWA4_9CHLR|nr:glycosyltransferase [Caldilineaceae bacterium]MYD90664.1 glycosyltransferase family 4 protein [Caldilineaceae bacterium SB0662_bin_9]
MTDHLFSDRTALVHDWLNQMGGAENVLEVLHGMFPSAPIYTSLYVPQRMPDAMRGWDIRTSWLNRIPGRDRLARYLLPLYPGAFRSMNLVGHDLVISIKSAFCLGVRTAADGNRARHVCYCLTPTRFLWNFDQYMVREQVSGPARTVTRIMLERLRRWELEAAKGVDDFIAISTAVQERIRDVYSRDSTVIHPPVDTGAFRPRMAAPREGFYLVVSRLIPYKRIDLAVSAFNRMPDRNLVIVGEGRDAAALKAMAGSNIRFTDYLPRRKVVDLMQRCRGFIFPGEEDFGITPVEAMSAGSPVVALRAGGALDTVADQQTGIFFDHSEPEALREAIEAADAANWDREVLYRQADQFSTELFRERFRRFLAAA